MKVKIFEAVNPKIRSMGSVCVYIYTHTNILYIYMFVCVDMCVHVYLSIYLECLCVLGR